MDTILTPPPAFQQRNYQPRFTVLTGRLGTVQKNLSKHLIRAMTPAFDPTILTLIQRRRSPSCLSVRAVECCSSRVQAVRRQQDYRLSHKHVHPQVAACRNNDPAQRVPVEVACTTSHLTPACSAHSSNLQIEVTLPPKISLPIRGLNGTNVQFESQKTAFDCAYSGHFGE
jgi:hypothetical protein